MLIQENKQKWAKIFLVTPIFCFIIFGYVLSQIAGNVLFVKRIGADYLPYIYVVNAILGFMAVVIVTGNIATKSIAKMMQLISFLAIIIFLFSGILIQKQIIYGYPIFLIFSQVIYMILSSVMVWDLGLKVCTPFEAKSLFGYFSLGASTGGIMAGISSTLLSNIVKTESLIFIVVISLVFVIVNSIIIQRYYSVKLKNPSKSKETSYLDSLKKGFEYLKMSNMAKILSVIFILFCCIRWIGDYEFQRILGQTFNENYFAKISGIVTIVENTSLIIILLFLQKWIISKLGVLNTTLISPTIILFPFVILFVYPFYISAVAVKLIIRVVNYSIFNNSSRLIFTAIPNIVRSSAMAFIRGNAESSGMLAAGVGLIFLTKLVSNKGIIAIGVLLLIMVIYLIIVLKKEYVKQISNNLESTDRNDVHSAIENFAEPSYRRVGVQELMKMVKKPNLDIETIRKVVFALGQINNVKVIPALLDIFNKYDITIKYAVVEAIHNYTHLNEQLSNLPFTRLNLIEAYEKIFLEEEDPDLKVFILEHIKDFDPSNIITFLKEAINNKNSEIQYQAIKAMKYFRDRGIIKYIKPFLNDERLMIRASCIIALWQFDEMRMDCMEHFVKLISDRKNKDAIMAAFFIISKLNIIWENRYVEGYLQDRDEQIKTMAALTLLEIGNIKGMQIIINNLVKETPYSIVIARNIKNLSKKVREKLLEIIRGSGEESVNICIISLNNTYLNFNDEINYLTNEKSSLSSMGVSAIK